MATDQELLVVIDDAMNAATPEERQNSRTRFLIMLKAALPHLLPEPPPPPAPVEPQKPYATMTVNFVPEDDETKQELESVNARLWALIKKIAPVL